MGTRSHKLVMVIEPDNAVRQNMVKELTEAGYSPTSSLSSLAEAQYSGRTSLDLVLINATEFVWRDYFAKFGTSSALARYELRDGSFKIVSSMGSRSHTDENEVHPGPRLTTYDTVKRLADESLGIKNEEMLAA